MRAPPGLLQRYPILHKQLKISRTGTIRFFKVKWHRVRIFLKKKLKRLGKMGEKARDEEFKRYQHQLQEMDSMKLMHHGLARVALESLQLKAYLQQLLYPEKSSTAERYMKKKEAACERLRTELDTKYDQLRATMPFELIIPGIGEKD